MARRLVHHGLRVHVDHRVVEDRDHGNYRVHDDGELGDHDGIRLTQGSDRGSCLIDQTRSRLTTNHVRFGPVGRLDELLDLVEVHVDAVKPGDRLVDDHLVLALVADVGHSDTTSELAEGHLGHANGLVHLDVFRLDDLSEVSEGLLEIFQAVLDRGGLSVSDDRQLGALEDAGISLASREQEDVGLGGSVAVSQNNSSVLLAHLRVNKKVVRYSEATIV